MRESRQDTFELFTLKTIANKDAYCAPSSLTQDVKERVREALDSLDESSRGLIVTLFGLDSEERVSPPNLAENLGVSLSKLNQMTAQALRALRSQAGARRLATQMD
jgi:DNA-directed RNA polymerase sigma subunit (sigma70/sigma32)